LAVAAIEVNAQLNKVQIATLLEDLIYAENPRHDENGGWDIVVAGDLWYNARLARHGVAWLQGLASQGVLVLAGDPGRQYSRSDGLERVGQYTARSVPDLEHANVQTVDVFYLLPGR
jgi:predicted nicotinamide N-methyase